MKQLLCLAGVTVVVVTGCRASSPPDSGASVNRTAVRETAQILLETNCGRCHISALDTALPEALAIFDLVEQDWWQRLTPEQLRSAMARMEDVLGTEPNEVADRELFRIFVELEIKDRRL